MLVILQGMIICAVLVVDKERACAALEALILRAMYNPIVQHRADALANVLALEESMPSMVKPCTFLTKEWKKRFVVVPSQRFVSFVCWGTNLCIKQLNVSSMHAEIEPKLSALLH